MDHDFWHNKWKNNEIAFHADQANPLLVQYLTRLPMPTCDRVFVPLCGKALDISWLLDHGYRIAGIDLSAIAIEQLFCRLKVDPTITDAGELRHYSATGIDLFAGDIFQLSQAILGPVDMTYDRAALVALPEAMRDRYTAHVIEITSMAPQLLISYEYDQTVLEGPPFSIDSDEMNRHYARAYEVTRLATVDVPGGLKGRCPARESVWLLTHQ